MEPSMRLMNWIQVVLLLACLGGSLAAESAPDAPQQQVRRFVAAFNAQDVDAMLELTHAEIEWFSIDGDKLGVETRGRVALRTYMLGYFKSCPSCRSKLTQMAHTATRVSAIEVASWQGKEGRRTQRGMAVYEFQDGLIRRVYYFPSEQ
jgi:ketosteroid isomerase-like protein